MLSHFFTRLAGAVLTICCGALAIFLALHAAPGDPAITVLGENSNPATIAAFRHLHGLDLPVMTQFGRFVLGALRGDAGYTLTVGGGVSVSQLILQRLPNTLFVGTYAILIALALSLVLGTASAAHRGRFTDTVITVGSVALISMPDFWLSYMLVILLALDLGLFPPYGFVTPATSLRGALLAGFLPALAMSAQMTGFFARVLRSSLLEAWSRNYVMAGRALGLPGSFIYMHYVLRNAVVPLVVVVGLQIRNLLGGVVIIEKIFGVPGVGSLMVDAVFARDYPLVLGCAVTFLLIVVLMNVAVDTTCLLLDPRRAR